MKGILNMFTKIQTENEKINVKLMFFHKAILISHHLLFSRYPYIPEVKRCPL